MRTGSPTWKIKVGPISIKLEYLTQISFPKTASQELFINSMLTEDIRVNGLKEPLEINWTLEETLMDRVRIFKGNQRIQALRNLGLTEAPCNLTIEGYQDTEKVGEILKRFLGQ